VVTNTGNEDLRNFQVTDNLGAIFTAPASFTIVSGPTITGAGGLTPNAGFNGLTGAGNSTSLISTTSPGNTLFHNATNNNSNTITFIVQVTPSTRLGPYTNSATTTGTLP